jgi:hypothetical protein
MIISEKQVLDAIASVLMENRKVLKIGSQTPSAPPVPDMSMQQPMQDPSMGTDPMMGQSGTAGGPGDPGMMDPNMGGDPNGDMGNQFDTNFDAGVEADEETDPKHYIQQLTGKLSQSINSFNSEQGADAGLCKYVASMIIAATCKNLDDKAKKELIEKINNASSDEEMPDDSQEETGDDMGADGQDMPMDDTQQQPVMENSMKQYWVPGDDEPSMIDKDDFFDLIGSDFRGAYSREDEFLEWLEEVDPSIYEKVVRQKDVSYENVAELAIKNGLEWDYIAQEFYDLTPVEIYPDDLDEQRNLHERCFTKKKLMEMFGMGDGEKERQDNLPNKIKTNKKTIFNGKTFR